MDSAGIAVVAGAVQSEPTSEEQAQAWSDALVFAEEHPDDVGYPYVNPETGTLELSSASAKGAELLNNERSTLKTTTTIRAVKFSFGKLEGIKHEVTTLRAEEVPDADLIYMTAPDHESNRIVITVKEPSDRLFKELAGRYGTDAIAVQVDRDGPGGSPASRHADYSPFYGGATIFGVDDHGHYCTDSFAWAIGSQQGNALLTAAHCAPLGGPVQVSGLTVGDVSNIYEENWNDQNGTTYYSGQSVYRGDVALIRLRSGSTSAPFIYRGGSNSGTASQVISRYGRYSALNDKFYLGGQTTGETGPYTVKDVGIDWWYSNQGPNVWVRNVSRANGSAPCMDLGDSGGSIFATVTGGVKAAGTLSGYGISTCVILFTDIYRTYLGLPGDILD